MIEEAEKGCGKKFKWKEDKEIYWSCGEKIGCNELVCNSEKIMLCPSCQTKLQTLHTVEKIFNETVARYDETLKGIDEDWRNKLNETLEKIKEKLLEGIKGMIANVVGMKISGTKVINHINSVISEFQEKE